MPLVPPDPRRPLVEPYPPVRLPAAAGFHSITQESKPMVEWYLHSRHDENAHCGRLNADGTATARCGSTFSPQQPELLSTEYALPGPPVDPGQMCPGCRRDRRGTDDDGDTARVRDLMEKLSSPGMSTTCRDVVANAINIVSTI